MNTLQFEYLILCWTFGLFAVFSIFSLFLTAGTIFNRSFVGHMFSCLLVKYLGVKLLDHKVLLIFINCQTTLKSDCFTLYSNQRYTKVLVAPHPL